MTEDRKVGRRTAIGSAVGCVLAAGSLASVARAQEGIRAEKGMKLGPEEAAAPNLRAQNEAVNAMIRAGSAEGLKDVSRTALRTLMPEQLKALKALTPRDIKNLWELRAKLGGKKGLAIHWNGGVVW